MVYGQAGDDEEEIPGSSAPPKQGRPPASGMAKKKSPYSLSQLILQALGACNVRRGLSLAAIKQHLSEAGFNVSKNNSRLKMELNNLVSNGVLVRVAGPGDGAGSGLFKFKGFPKRSSSKDEAGKKPAENHDRPTGKQAAASRKPPKGPQGGGKKTAGSAKKKRQLRKGSATAAGRKGTAKKTTSSSSRRRN